MNDDIPPTLHRPDEPEGEIERLLLRNSFRTPPPDWRGLILERAMAGQSGEDPTGEVGCGYSGPELGNGSGRDEARMDGVRMPVGTRPEAFWILILQRLASGWTVAVAVWALILGLNQYSMPRGDSLPSPKAPWSAKALAEIQAHQRLLVDFSENGASRGPVSRSGSEQERDVRRPPVVRPRAGQETRETQYNV